ncbi:MAG: hypothetical protein U0T33_03110 [Bacteroidales bacterium]
MKTSVKIYSLMIITASALVFTSCNKNSTNNDPLNTMPSDESIKVENVDVQDAVADKNEMEIDNTLDQLQVLNYSTTSLKDALLTGSRTVTVDHPDSTTFPKVITITYNNYQDSTANESFIKNGEIQVTVTAGNNKLLVTRVQVFKNFSITTDSTTVTVSGTRTVTRQTIQSNFNGFTSLRVVARDNITGSLNYAITKTGVSDSLKFTRVVAKVRTAYLNFSNVGGASWATARFKNILAKDTITWSGSVTGQNEFNESYSKTVDAATPITMIFYKGTPVLASGTMIVTIEGLQSWNYTITFSEAPEHPHMTLVKVKNNATGEYHTFLRRFSRRYARWW